MHHFLQIFPTTAYLLVTVFLKDPQTMKIVSSLGPAPALSPHWLPEGIMTS